MKARNTKEMMENLPDMYKQHFDIARRTVSEDKAHEQAKLLVQNFIESNILPNIKE